MIRKGVACMIMLAVIAVSCKRDKSHLSPEELAPILADLHIADAYSGMLRDSLHPSLGKNYDSLAVWTKAILAKYEISQKEFSESMDWYRDRPSELDSLYAKVIPVLERAKK